MPYNALTNTFDLSELMQKLVAERNSAFDVQKAKHEDWTDNYDLDRGKVRVNRLTMRQAVNIPLMKETRKTMLSRIDDPPHVEWKEKSGDLEKQLIYQAKWDQHLKDNNLELIDVIDKNNVLMYGSSTKWLNIGEKGIKTDVSDIYDVLFDPLMNPWDLESARYIVKQNIFKSVRDILADPKYMASGKEELRYWADSPAGIVQSEKNKEEWDKKMQRLKDMGVDSSKFATFAAGDTLVNLTEHFTKVWSDAKKKFEKRVIVYADFKIELYNERLIDCVGIDMWPCVRWAEDPQLIDIYPDSIADLVRTPNKIMNVWFSQLIENRTLKNFQMHWFLPAENYTPQSYTPGPGMMLPAPAGDDINKVIKPVQIDGLDDTMGAIQALTTIVERATGATAIEKGQPEKGQQTLGEVQILVGKAQERTIAMAKFYRLAWQEYAMKWDMMMQANTFPYDKLYKTGRSGKVYEKSIYQKDWKSEAGYMAIVRSTSEQETESLKGIQKFQYVMSQFPNNPALRAIAQKRELEMLDLSPDELKQIEDAELQIQEQATAQPQAETPVNPEVAQLNQRAGNLQEILSAPANAGG